MNPDLLTELIPLGPTVMLVVLLFFSDKEKKKLQEIIIEQVEDKKVMRSDRSRLEDMIKEFYTHSTRILAIMERIEKSLNRATPNRS